MNFKFPFWSIALAIFSYLPITYFELDNWVALIPTAYLAFAFIAVSIYAIKRTFSNK